MIKKEGSKYCVYDSTGSKKLGCHSTHGEAVIQIKAIEANKSKKHNPKGGGGK